MKLRCEICGRKYDSDEERLKHEPDRNGDLRYSEYEKRDLCPNCRKLRAVVINTYMTMALR